MTQDVALTAEVREQIALAQDVVDDMRIAGHNVSLLDVLDSLAAAGVQLAPCTDRLMSNAYFAQLHVGQA